MYLTSCNCRNMKHLQKCNTPAACYIPYHYRNLAISPEVTEVKHGALRLLAVQQIQFLEWSELSV